jgi:hypothetical protein
VPNWIHNRLIVIGESDELALFVTAAEGADID